MSAVRGVKYDNLSTVHIKHCDQKLKPVLKTSAQLKSTVDSLYGAFSWCYEMQRCIE